MTLSLVLLLALAIVFAAFSVNKLRVARLENGDGSATEEQIQMVSPTSQPIFSGT